MRKDDHHGPWWQRSYHEGRRPALMARGRIMAAMRHWLALHDFVEIDPNALQTSPGNEAHLHAFATDMLAIEGGHRRMYLHTSPEFAMKKLLTAGERKIASFAHVWRNRERGPLHSPEFTMVEWYRAGESYEILMQDCAHFLRMAVQAAGSDLLRWRGAVCDPLLPFERLSVADAFATYAGIDLFRSITLDGGVLPDMLADDLKRIGLRTAPDDTWSDMFSRVMVAHIEPRLGLGHAVMLDRYPVAEAALARPCADDPRVAERFELYACGVELANGFGELTDPVQQRKRFEQEMAEKWRIYGEEYPLDEDFLAALADMPPASGIALGFDRLVMLATAAPHIDRVIWTPISY